MHWVYGNWLSRVSCCRAWVHTELWSAGFAHHGGHSCAPCYPVITVGFVNGPFTRQLSNCSLTAASFTGSQCDAQLFGTLCLLMLHNCEGGLASLTGVLVMLLDVLHSAFSLHKVWERILTTISRGKVGLWCCPVTRSLCSSFKDNNWPQVFVGFLHSARCIRQLAQYFTTCWHLLGSNHAVHSGCIRQSYLRIKTLYFSRKALFKLKLLSCYMKKLLW